MDIQTKDGILLRGIPDGTPDDVIKERIAKIRGTPQVAPEVPKQEPETDWLRKIALGGRAAFEGATALPLMAADALSQGPLRRALGDPQPSPQDQVKSLINKSGAYSPQSGDERILTDVVGGATGALSGGGPLKSALGALTAGGASGLASGATREAGGSTLMQVLAGLAGGIAPAALKGAVGGIGDKIADVGATIGAGFGNKAGTIRLAKDAAQRASGTEADFIRAAERNATTFVPGATPTTAEAIAQRNALTQDVRGGATARLQSDLTGAMGAEGVLPSVAKKQKTSILDAAAPFAGGLTRKDQEQALLDALAKRKEVTDPMRKQVFEQANIAGVKGPQLEAKAQSFADAAANKVEDVRRFTNAGATADDYSQAGRMALDGTKNQRGLELGARAERVAQSSADSSLPLGEAARFAKMQADSISQSGFAPLSSKNITSEIDRTLATPGQRASDVVESTLNATKDKIAKFTDPKTGVIDVRDLATIRNEIGSTIKKFAGESKNWDQRLAAGLETDVKKQIDAAITKSIGSDDWTRYLKTYGSMSKEADKLKVGQAIFDKLQNEKGDLTPNSVLNVLGRGEDALLKTKSGMQRDVGGLEGLYGNDYGKMQNIVDHLTRQASAKQIAGEVKGSSAGNLAASDIPTLPNLLSRPAMVANFALKVLGKGANEPVAREISQRLANGTYSELLTRPASDPARKVIEAMIRASTATTANQGMQP